MASTKYGLFLSYSEFDSFQIDYKIFNLVSTDTYNEYELKETIINIGKEVCGAIAIQLAVVGYGNKSYGKVRFMEKEIDIDLFFKKNNIKSDLSINAKLKSGDVTPRRLIRFFRFLIKDYIEKNSDCQTYLFKKYCLDKNDQTRAFIFPGFEHAAEPIVDSEKVKKNF